MVFHVVVHSFIGIICIGNMFAQNSRSSGHYLGINIDTSLLIDSENSKFVHVKNF